MNKLLICAYLIFINYAFVCNGQRPFYLGSGQKPTCVNEGDYCRFNADCCTQNCSTSRCVATTTMKINNDTNLSQQQNNNINISTTTISTLQNRFNEASSAGVVPNCLRINDSCKAGQDCCSKTCFKSQCVSADKRQNFQCSGVNQKCSTNPRGCCDFLNCENNVCRDRAIFVEGTETFGYSEPPYSGLNNRFGEDDNQTTVAPGPCKEVGGKCFRHEDCCSPLRCHSFLHQCVT
ncbi:hypothetical protein PVAND_003113 [Polypedilum vanderplanki]|uniref:Uncharacterized protein n=1 Tax=Polypedilum vanderplanki TaxID=319348 RepID=A0A9J6BU51_POLVA|nr:hypothetical protein PVAND_003113 [Polypedilum vanderplanki]